MRKVKYLILGAGVSGLTFSNQVDDADYVILEKESEAGGYCRTIRANGYIWDYAGHFFHFTHPEIKEKFESIASSENTIYRVKNTKIYYKGNYVDYPFQKNIHQLSKEEMIECLVGLFEKAERKNYENFLDMLYGKFGMGITEKFLKPYNEKLYACDLNKLDVEAMGRFFPYANIRDIVLNMKKQDNTSYNKTFLYPKNGADFYIKKMQAGLDKDRIHLDENVIEVDIEKKIVKTNKNVYSYRYLISSIPLDQFAKIAHLGVDKAIFTYNKVLVFNMGFDRPSIDGDIHWIYVPDKSVNFYRVGFYNNILGAEDLSIYIEIGYPQDIDVDKKEIDRQMNETLKNLKKMKIVDQHKLVSYNVVLMDPAYVHVTREAIDVVERIKKELEEKYVYIIGRYGQWKYCSIEDCMIDALKVKELIG